MESYVRIVLRKTRITDSDPFTKFCKLSGIYSSIDREKVAMRILQILYKYPGLTSTQISRELDKSRGATLNQLENLQESGFVFKYGKEYYLREKNFSKIVLLIEKDIKDTLNQMKEIAREVDRYYSD